MASVVVRRAFKYSSQEIPGQIQYLYGTETRNCKFHDTNRGRVSCTRGGGYKHHKVKMYNFFKNLLLFSRTPSPGYLVLGIGHIVKIYTRAWIRQMTRNILTQASKNGCKPYFFPQKKFVSVFYAINIFNTIYYFKPTNFNCAQRKFHTFFGFVYHVS